MECRPKYFLDSKNCKKLIKTTPLVPPRMTEVVSCNRFDLSISVSQSIEVYVVRYQTVRVLSREECLCLKGSNCCMHGRMKGLVITPPWMMSLMPAANFMFDDHDECQSASRFLGNKLFANVCFLNPSSPLHVNILETFSI